jgi:hypothetical protein
MDNQGIKEDLRYLPVDKLASKSVHDNMGVEERKKDKS